MYEVPGLESLPTPKNTTSRQVQSWVSREPFSPLSARNCLLADLRTQADTVEQPRAACPGIDQWEGVVTDLFKEVSARDLRSQDRDVAFGEERHKSLRHSPVPGTLVP